MADTRSRILEIVGNVLHLDPKERELLRRNEPNLRLGKWDSVKHIEIVLALEREFGIEVSEEAIPRMNSIDKMTEYVEISTR
jgi:acyl carrier protein